MTKADKIRRYLAKGMTVRQIVDKLECAPSEVYRLRVKPKQKAGIDLAPLKTEDAPTSFDILAPVPTANDIQIGGSHYNKYGKLQPWDAYWMWNLNPFQAAVLKYTVRYRDKEGINDLQKARHYLDKLIELEMGGA